MTWRGIDGHAHLATSEHWTRPQIDSWFTPLGIDPQVMDIDPDQLIEDYAKGDILFGVALALDARRGIGIHVPNDYVARICAGSAGKLIGFASVDPLAPDAVESLEEATELGLVGLKIAPTYQNFHPQDEAALRLYAACADRNLPVLIHQGGTVHEAANRDVQSLEHVEAISDLFPTLDIVVAHMGQPAERQLVDIMARRANVYGDVSGLDAEGFGPGMAEMVRLVWHAKEVGVADRLFWGSDNPWSQPSESLRTWEQALVKHLAGVADPSTVFELTRSLLFANMLSFAARHGWDVPDGRR